MIAIFCNGFDGIVGKVKNIFLSCDIDLIAYLPEPKRKFHVKSPFEAELYRNQDNPTILHGLLDCLKVRSYVTLVIPKNLGAKRTLLVVLITMFSMVAVVELDLSNYGIQYRPWLELVGLLFRRVFSKRTLNTLLLKLSNRLKLPRIMGYPVNMNVETVSVCNLRCPACATGLNALGRSQGFMDFEKYKRMIEECGPYLNNLVLHIYGEPMLHKDIIKFIKCAKENGVRTVELSTNANVKMTEEYAREFVLSGLDTLIVSMDGTDQITYEIYRRTGKLDLVKNFITAIVKAKAEERTLLPVMEVQFITMRHNIHQVEEARQLSISLGADGFRAKMFDATFADIGLDAAMKLLPEGEIDTHFRVVDGKLVSAFATNNNFCPIVWDTVALTWDGHMIPCCFDEKGSVVLGDAYHVGGKLFDVWNSDKFVAFRKEILTNRKAMPLCGECPWV